MAARVSCQSSTLQRWHIAVAGHACHLPGSSSRVATRPRPPSRTAAAITPNATTPPLLHHSNSSSSAIARTAPSPRLRIPIERREAANVLNYAASHLERTLSLQRTMVCRGEGKCTRIRCRSQAWPPPAACCPLPPTLCSDRRCCKLAGSGAYSMKERSGMRATIDCTAASALLTGSTGCTAGGPAS